MMPGILFTQNSIGTVIFSELRAVGSQDLLSIRFAILKGVRDDETRKALSINKQLNAVKTDNILDTI